MKDTINSMYNLNTPYNLSHEQIEFFKTNGYIKLNNVLSKETLEIYSKIISDKVKELNTQHLPIEERELYQKAFLQIGNLWTKSAEIKEFSFSKRLAQIAAELLEVSGVRMYHDQALFKEAGGGFTPWHADQQYWPLKTDKSVTAWIPLQETTLEMGPLAFAEGSHTSGFAKDLEISAGSEEAIEKYIKENKISCNESPFDLGEVSFHYGWTLHKAGPNNSRDMRAVMTVIYMDENMTLQEPLSENQRMDRDAFCAGISVGDVIDSPLNPVLFNRKNKTDKNRQIYS